MSNLTPQLESLNGRVILLKSIRLDGHYIDSRRSRGVKLTGCPRSQLLETSWCKFIVHHIERNIVCFESFESRDHYLDLNHNKYSEGNHHIIKISGSYDIPKDKPWARFSIFGNDLSNVGIRSERWTNRWLDAHHSTMLLGTKHDPDSRPMKSWGQFDIRFSAPIQDSYVMVASHYNDTGNTLKGYKFYSKVGMSSTDSTRISNSISVKIEAEKNFGCPLFSSGSVKFGAEYSHQWSIASSQTWEAETGIEIPIDIPPGKTAKIYQLIANYGPLRVGSNFTKNEEVNGDATTN